jgi:hypothetical protein
MYYDRYDEATTSLALSKEGIEHYVLCHSDAAKFTCIGSTGTIIETGEPKGIQNNFNWALKNTKKGDWCIFLSDDYTKSKILQGDKFINVGIEYPIEEIKKAIIMSENIGVKLIGLNSVGNPFFVTKRITTGGLVDGRCFAIQRTDFLFDESISTIPDYYSTCWHLKRYKKNIILNYTFMDFKRYGKKGLGSVTERMEQKKQDCLTIMKAFPELAYFKNKPGQEENSHIVIRNIKTKK